MLVKVSKSDRRATGTDAVCILEGLLFDSAQARHSSKGYPYADLQSPEISCQETS